MKIEIPIPMIRAICHPLFLLAAATLTNLAQAAATVAAPGLTLVPFHAAGIYAPGDTVGWKITLPAGVDRKDGDYTYSLKKNGLVMVKSGKLEFAAGSAVIEATVGEPAMIFAEVVSAEKKQRSIAAAAVAPTQLAPSVPCPADFDEFWTAKIKLLHGIPADPKVTPDASGKAGVEYEKVTLTNINGAHAYCQLARPARQGKFPAMLIMQWASSPYPLQKAWVTDRAAEGWLAFNVEPHDVPLDLPQAYYDALPQLIKDYRDIYNDDRDRNYFLQMYLGDYRALDYLASRPEWDGKILLVMGTSMGGQQSVCVAGLHPKVTHLIVHVPAGADSNGSVAGRAVGYPFWDQNNPQVRKTALYFDTVNFAPRIKATCLYSLGFVDEVCPPAGTWTAFNQIRGPKEVIPLVNAPHNHLATEEQQRAYVVRSAEWLKALASGTELKLRKFEEPHRQGTSP